MGGILDFYMQDDYKDEVNLDVIRFIDKVSFSGQKRKCRRAD